MLRKTIFSQRKGGTLSSAIAITCKAPKAPISQHLGRMAKRSRGLAMEEDHAAAGSSRTKCESAEASKSHRLQSEKPEKIQGFVVTDHWLTVPLDHFSTTGGGDTIRVFAREVRWRTHGPLPLQAPSPSPQHEELHVVQVVATNKVRVTQPYLCFFQGGPGFESPVPSETQQWLTAASKYFRVILLDQRGTGKSTQIRASTLSAVGDVDAQAAYLRHFRADSIVADAELLRQELLADAADKRWCVLGQSFGGFCCLRYLSYAPQGLMLPARAVCPWCSALS
jgi:hypothetical protein